MDALEPELTQSRRERVSFVRECVRTYLLLLFSLLRSALTLTLTPFLEHAFRVSHSRASRLTNGRCDDDEEEDDDESEMWATA